MRPKEALGSWDLYIMLELKKKRGVWLGTSKDRKEIHMEMQKQIFGKQLFSGSSL